MSTLRQTVAALVLVSGAAGAVEPVPLPDLSTMDPAVAEQLETAWRLLAEQSETDPESAATAYGAFGRICLLYELAESARISFENARQLDPGSFQWAYYHGYGRQQAGDFDAAAEALAAAIELDPTYLAARQRLGEVELDRQRPDVAAAIFHDILERDPEYTAARYGLGSALLLERDYAAAATALEKVVAAQPEAATAHYQLGLAYRGLGRLDEARELLARHGRSRVTFDDPLVVTLDDLGRGKGLPLTIAVAARNGGDLDTAIASFRTALDSDPQDVAARTGLAATLIDGGFPELALRELEEILRLDADNVYAHFASGQLLASAGRFEQALPHLERAIELEPEVAQTLGFLGYTQSRLGRLTEAEASFSRALELGAERPRLLMQRATVRNQRSDFEGALRDLEELLAIEPGDVEALQASASLYARQGRFADAAAAFGALLERRPDDGAARFGRGLALLLARDYPTAIRHLDESVARSADAALEHLLARALATVPQAELRDADRALAIAGRLMERAPTAEHAETLAMALAAAGSFNDAATLQQQVIDQAGGGSAAQRRRLELYRAGRRCVEPWLAS